MCSIISWMLGVSESFVDQVLLMVGMGFMDSTADGILSLKEGVCMGSCGGAPLFLFNYTRMCEFLTPEKVDAILEELK